VSAADRGEIPANDLEMAAPCVWACDGADLPDAAGALAGAVWCSPSNSMLVLASCTAVAGIGVGTCGHQTGFPVCMQHAFSWQLTVLMAMCRDLLDSWFQSTMAPAFNGMSQPNKYSTGGTLPGGASLELQSPALPGTGGSCGTDSRAVQALQHVGGMQLPEHGAAAAGGVQYPVKAEPADAEEPAMGAAAGAWGKSFKVPPLDLRDGAKRPRTSGARPTLHCVFIKQCPDSSKPGFMS